MLTNARVITTQKTYERKMIQTEKKSMQFLVGSKFDEKSLLLRRLEVTPHERIRWSNIVSIITSGEERLKRPMFIDLERPMFIDLERPMFIKSDQIVIDFSLKQFFRPLY